MLSEKTIPNRNLRQTITNKDCAHAYNVCVHHYYKRNSNKLPSEFDIIAIVLQREGINPNDFYNWGFGILERHPKYPPKPKRFEDPKLIPLFHQQRY